MGFGRVVGVPFLASEVPLYGESNREVERSRRARRIRCRELTLTRVRCDDGWDVRYGMHAPCLHALSTRECGI